MQSAREKLAPVLDAVEFSAPKFPVLSNVTGRPHSSDPGAIKAAMLEQRAINPQPYYWAPFILLDAI